MQKGVDERNGSRGCKLGGRHARNFPIPPHQGSTGPISTAQAIAADYGVTVSPAWKPVPGWRVQQTLRGLQQRLESGEEVCLLCHCKRPFAELGGQESPCHAEALREALLDPRYPAGTCCVRSRADYSSGKEHVQKKWQRKANGKGKGSVIEGRKGEG